MDIADSKKLLDLQDEFKEVLEEIEECPADDRKKLFNLVKRREWLFMDIQALICNKSNG